MGVDNKFIVYILLIYSEFMFPNLRNKLSDCGV